MKLLDKFVFDFFQTLAFRLRQAAPYEDASCEADDAIEPECPGCAQSRVQYRERVSQYKQAAHKANVQTDMATPRMRLGNISEMMTHMVVANVMA